ncbi:MAG: hypothetical protein WBQ85_14195, partial [Candidatus Sulfotelmatobacter sp.]
YGWTWVGFEPWGWAPYHYGRWMWYGNSWAWWPGPVWGAGFYRPFWSPAYVSFFGFGGGWGLGFGFGWGGWGSFGWLPLGPCDRFYPWWGGYAGRFGVVGVNRFGTLNRFGGIAPLHAGTQFSNVAHINDPHIGGALSTVAAGKFGAGRTTAVAATRAQLSGARMMTGNMPVVPTHASLSASGRAAAPSTIHNNAAQHFFGTQSTSHAESFQQQTARLQQSMQRSHFSPVAAGAHTTGPGFAESRPAESRSAESRSASTAGVGRPSAAAPGRDANSSVTRSAGNDAATNENRGEQASSTQASSTRGDPNRGEWKTFTPPSRSNESAGRAAGAADTLRGDGGSYWNRTAPSSSYSREAGASNGVSNYERGAGSRPQLNMRQPIVQPRSSGGYGGYRAAPGYGASRPGYSGGASHSAPSSGGASHSAGGGHSGGGGHH